MQVYELMAILAGQYSGSEVFLKVDLNGGEEAGNWLSVAEFDEALLGDNGVCAVVLRAQMFTDSE